MHSKPEHYEATDGKNFTAGTNEYSKLGAEQEAKPDPYIGQKRGFYSVGSSAGEHPYAGHEGTYLATPNEDPLKATITIINPDGAAVVAPDTDYTRQMLDSSGYRAGEGFTGFDAENPRDPDAWNRARAANFYTDAYAKSGANPGYAEFNGNDMGGRFLTVDHAALLGAAADDKLNAPDRNDPDVLARRAESVGRFSVNNGIVAAVDGTGLQHEAPATESRLQALRAAGYSEGNVSVVLGTYQLDPHFNQAREWDRIKEADAMNRRPS